MFVKLMMKIKTKSTNNNHSTKTGATLQLILIVGTF